ncbi:succinate dehydrogenase, hydrophobic membrane anchor protein [Pseudoalteromonas aurantia]|nr:succinate dehydrogenase, hydrophobic membrane anchor protein [Pseudoalteromonas aurantia]
MAMINLSGTQQWILQRICNVIIILFVAAMIGYLVLCGPITFLMWSSLHGALWFKMIATVVLTATMMNGILAAWQIAGDYIKGRFNTLFNIILVALNLGLWGFGLGLLWGGITM